MINYSVCHNFRTFMSERMKIKYLLYEICIMCISIMHLALTPNGNFMECFNSVPRSTTTKQRNFS